MKTQTVLVLREPDRFGEILKASGLNVMHLPITETRPAGDLSDLQSKIERLDEYDGCFFTSPVAAEIFVEALERGNTAYAGKIYVLGERAKRVFEKAGFDFEYRNDVNTAREFIESFQDDEFTGRKFLFVRGERSMRIVPDLVGEIATVDEVVVYNTVDVHPAPDRLNEIRQGIRNGEIDWACFFSPSAVESFLKIFKLSELNGIRTAAIGETTGNRIKGSGLPLEFVSGKASADGFAAELIEHITKH